MIHKKPQEIYKKKEEEKEGAYKFRLPRHSLLLKCI